MSYESEVAGAEEMRFGIKTGHSQRRTPVSVMGNKPQQELIRQATTAQGAPPSVVRRRRRTYANIADFRRKRPYHRTSKNSSSLAAAGGALMLCLGTTPGALRTVFAAAKEAISVVTPTTVEAGVAFSVEWEFATDSEVSGTTGDLNPFEIELRWCGEDGDECESSACGSAYLSLCERELGCMDSDGSYDVVIPSDVNDGEYVIKVTYLGVSGWASASSLASFGKVSDCSGTFFVENSGSSADDGIPFLEATAPETELEAGEAFTARWKYDDGEGNGEGFFEVNLYECNDGSCADGSCGTFTDSLCSPEGCYDPGMGDYDVRLPATISPGKFKLQVKTSVEDEEGGDALSACTNTTFDVVASPYGATVPPSGETFPPSGAPSPGTGTPSMTETGVPSTTETEAPSTSETVAPSSETSAPSVATASPLATALPTETIVPTPTPVETTAMPAAAPTTSSSMIDSSIPGVSPTPVPGRVNCSSSATLTYSYEIETSGMPLVVIAHESGDRDEGGCATLTGLWEWLLSGPSGVPSDLLHPVNPLTNVTDTSGTAVATGVWLLRTSVDITNGVLFEVKGTDAFGGGDCDRLLLSSSSDLYIRLRGWGGSLYFEETHVTSWVEETGTEHMFGATPNGSSPRSYIGCVSEILEPNQTCDGVAQKNMGLCRMDIMYSVLGYLGYDATESYGITWKVRGLCEDLSNVETLFKTVRVYGDMMNSDIHHMWYGMYSYGHLGGVWTDNLMHDNHIYGFDPHDDSDFITIQGNTVWNNGDHGIIASKRCDHLLVKDNESFDNNGSGIMLHRSCDDSTVEGNKAYNNYDAGLSLVETSRTLVKDNEFDGNRWGIRVLAGSNNNTMEYNTCSNNTDNDVLQYIGSEADTPLVAPYTGFNERNLYRRNTITAHVQYTMDFKDSLYTVISNNEFVGPSRLSFLRTNVTRLSDNTGPAVESSPKVRRSCFTQDSNVLPVC